jgi:hypothetical protein
MPERREQIEQLYHAARARAAGERASYPDGLKKGALHTSRRCGRTHGLEPATSSTSLSIAATSRARKTHRRPGSENYNIACVYAVLGDIDKAMAWLERSVDTGFPCWPFFRIDPQLENLRKGPAFTRLVADLEQTYTALKIQRL